MDLRTVSILIAFSACLTIAACSANPQRMGRYEPYPMDRWTHADDVARFADALASRLPDVETAELDRPTQHFALTLDTTLQNYAGDTSAASLADAAIAALSTGTGEHEGPESITDHALTAMLATLDSSAYLTDEAVEDVLGGRGGRRGAIGVALRTGKQGLEVLEVVNGSPADRAGLRAGDRLRAIEGTSTSATSTTDAALLLRGPLESSVLIGVLRPSTGERFERRIVRETVDVPPVRDARVTRDGLAYVRITAFEHDTAHRLDLALRKLIRERPRGVRGVAIDLRANDGGPLLHAAETAELFLRPRATICSLDGPNLKAPRALRASPQAGSYFLPVVLVVDADTASGAEIFTAALRDRGTARIIGRATAGTADIQTTIRLSRFTAAKLFTHRVISPSGEKLDGPIEPDLRLSATYLASEAAKEDLPLQALRVLGELAGPER